MRLARVLDAHGRPWVAVHDAADDAWVPVADGEGRAGQEAVVALAMAARGGAAPPDAAADSIPADGARLLTPVPEPPSIRDFFAFEGHVKTAREGRGLSVPEDWYELPVFYFTNPAAVLGPDDPVRKPAGDALDYELEVACIIGREAADLDADDPAALDVIAGFTIMNDWSARDLQMREMQLMLGPAKGKDFATSLGPWLVTPDELPGFDDGRPRGRMVARVNGEQWSEGELSDIHFTWGQLLAHASRDTRVRPGDVIGSGTCGTGCILELSISHGNERHPWLQPGDDVELEVERLGVLRNRVVARA